MTHPAQNSIKMWMLAASSWCNMNAIYQGFCGTWDTNRVVCYGLFLSMCMLKDQAEAVGWANLLELTAKR